MNKDISKISLLRMSKKHRITKIYVKGKPVAIVDPNYLHLLIHENDLLKMRLNAIQRPLSSFDPHLINHTHHRINPID